MEKYIDDNDDNNDNNDNDDNNNDNENYENYDNNDNHNDNRNYDSNDNKNVGGRMERLESTWFELGWMRGVSSCIYVTGVLEASRNQVICFGTLELILRYYYLCLFFIFI